jgi:hypothetical protein
MRDAATAVEKRSHKKLDPDIKAMRAINRALTDLPDDAHRRRVMEWVVARGLGKAWFSLPRFRWITGGDRG